MRECGERGKGGGVEACGKVRKTKIQQHTITLRLSLPDRRQHTGVYPDRLSGALGRRGAEGKGGDELRFVREAVANGGLGNGSGMRSGVRQGRSNRNCVAK